MQYVFCMVFCRDAVFGVSHFLDTLTAAFFGVLPNLIFYSRHEYSRKQSAVRVAVHFVVLNAVMLFIGVLLWGIDIKNPAQCLVFLLEVCFVYIMVWLIELYGKKREAKKLTEAITRKFKTENNAK